GREIEHHAGEHHAEVAGQERGHRDHPDDADLPGGPRRLPPAPGTDGGDERVAAAAVQRTLELGHDHLDLLNLLTVESFFEPGKGGSTFGSPAGLRVAQPALAAVVELRRDVRGAA